MGGKSVSSTKLDFFELEPHKLDNFDVLSEKILDILTKDLGFVIPSVIMYDKRVQGLRVINYRLPGGVQLFVKRTLGKDINTLVFPLSAKENLFVQTYLGKKMCVTDSVRDMVRPLLHQGTVKVFDKLLNVKMMAVVPILVDNACIGVFGFGSKQATTLTDVERYFLQNLSQQLGHYLKQAWIIKMLLESNQRQVKRNEDLLQMLSLNRTSIEALYELLDAATKNLEISNQSVTKIHEQLRYLQSLCLLSHHIESDTHYELGSGGN